MSAVVQKPVSQMTDAELNAEAHFIAVRIINGTATGRDSVVVMELSNRLLRYMPRRLPASDTITLESRGKEALDGMLVLDLLDPHLDILPGVPR